MATLTAQWALDCVALAPTAPAEMVAETGAALLARWCEPARKYHTTNHLQEVLGALAELVLAGELPVAEEPLARAAAWGHDAVYDVAEPAGNEAASATLMAELLTQLSVPKATVTEVSRLIRASERHDLPSGDDKAGATFHDADLWILSAPRPRFEEYCRQVREEYHGIPEDRYAAARAAILHRLADRPRLYATTHAQDRWAPAAAANLRRELARLGG
ncbi:MAG: hypothetical protein ACK5MP_04470 [Nostocoides sp.]